MAQTTITTEVVEEGSIAFTCAFTDEEGTATVPDSITWTLTDASGNVMNSRAAVSVSPAASVTIVLSGDDLSIGTYGRQRRLLVEWIYTSSLGTLPQKEEISFNITNLTHVT